MKVNKILNITTTIVLIMQSFSLAYAMGDKNEEHVDDQKKSPSKQPFPNHTLAVGSPEERDILPQIENLSLGGSNANSQGILTDREALPVLPSIMPDEQLKCLTEYFKSKGRQDYQLQESSPFLMTNQLRWVENIKNLNLSYGSKRRELTDAALLPFIMNSPNSIELDKIGVMLKIMNGYHNNFDKSSEHSFNLTPDKTNFLVPYISFLIQWNPGEKPAFIPGGYLSFHKNKHAAAVFASGRGDDLNNFSAFYNFILRTEEEAPIELIAGEDIKHLKIIRYLQKSEERFPVNLLKDMLESFCQKLQVKKEPKNDAEKANNKILYTGHLLYLIYSGKYEDATKYPNTLGSLDSQYANEKYKDKSKLKVKLQQDMKEFSQQQNLYDQAINRMKEESQHLQGKSFNEIKKYIQIFSSFHSEKIAGLQSSHKAKDIYQQLCELGLPAVTKHFDNQGGQTDEHTEPWFIQTLTHKPKSLLRLLEKVEIPEGAAPKLKLIAIDMHSWLDVCHKYPNCMRTLYNFKINGDWPKVLLSLQSALLSKGFRQNSKNGSPKPLRSVFRIFSERKYQSHPIALEGAGGGPKLLKRGFDAKLVSDLGLILAARRLPEDTKLRDSVIENIWHRIQNACLWRPQNFWYENRSIWKKLVTLSTEKPGALNGLVILNKLYGQAEIAFPLALAHQLHQTKYEYVGVSQKHLLIETQNMLENCMLSRLADIPNSSLEFLNFAHNRRYYLRVYPLEYAELYLAETYLKLADIFLTENEEGKGRENALKALYQWTEKLKYQYNWSGGELKKVQYEHDSPLSFDSPELSKKIYERVISYACKRAADLRNEEWGSPQVVEKSNLEKALILIRDLAQEDDDEAQSILQQNKSTFKKLNLSYLTFL